MLYMYWQAIYYLSGQVQGSGILPTLVVQLLKLPVPLKPTSAVLWANACNFWDEIKQHS